MGALNGTFILAVAIYAGVLYGLWRFWSPRDPILRRPPTLASGAGVLLLDGETLQRQEPASLYLSRADTQGVGGGALIAGGGGVAGWRPNKPGYAFLETGTLLLTNRRLVFIGPTSGYSMPLPSVLTADEDGHWLTIRAEGNGRCLRFRTRSEGGWRNAILAQVLAA